MSDTEEKSSQDRMPKGAIITVIVGLIATLGVLAIDLRGGSGSDSIGWTTTEIVDVPPQREFGKGGTFGLTRTTISALVPTESGDLLFRVAGSVEVDGGRTVGEVKARCDVTTTAPGSMIARTQKRRAAWPRPSIELQDQPVPEELVVQFKRRGAEVIGLPIRDSFRTFTDSAAPTEVDWDGFEEQTQNWVWTMPEGTGEGGATLGWAVVFRTTQRPVARIVCRADAGRDRKTVEVSAEQQEWPLEEPAETEEEATE
jgi:hypothetical protein